jgi:hypothetical protein
MPRSVPPLKIVVLIAVLPDPSSPTFWRAADCRVNGGAADKVLRAVTEHRAGGGGA